MSRSGGTARLPSPYHRVLKIARSVADLKEAHFVNVLSLRSSRSLSSPTNTPDTSG